ncbi:hypothetical protein HCB17_04475, partial [Salinispora arenicola]|uniref:hypothetical protein n=1 Tax=Salinispora arenicola TaxID=168697 RepID=UPI0014300DA4
MDAEQMVDKQVLLTPRLGKEADVPIPGVGTVRVRTLSRAEVIGLRKATDDAHLDGPRVLTLERKMLAAAMVAPVLTEAEVGRWQKSSPAGEMDEIVYKVQEMAGMLDTSPREAMSNFRGESG